MAMHAADLTFHSFLPRPVHYAVQSDSSLQTSFLALRSLVLCLPYFPPPPLIRTTSIRAPRAFL